MPVTARLSKKFYETFGEQVVNELVNWFNDVDTAWKSELREQNELNFARFDAKLEQRIAETNARMDAGFAACNARMDAGFARIDAALARLDAKLDTKADVAFVNVALANLRADLLKWMFYFWSGTMLTVLLTVLAVVLK